MPSRRRISTAATAIGRAVIGIAATLGRQRRRGAGRSEKAGFQVWPLDRWRRGGWNRRDKPGLRVPGRHRRY
jgi:hypothetical protein